VRYELKLVCQEAAYDRVRMALRLQREGIGVLYPPRRVHSLYLDTVFRRALEENLAGISRREKLRFRWYGEACDTVRGVLECKVRENMLGWKRSVAVEEPIRVEGSPRRTFVERLAAAIADEAWRHRLRHGLEPVQWITYLRDYLATADRRVRLTLDRALCAYDQRLCTRISRRRPSPLPRILVIELKCAPEALDAARQLANRLAVRIDRCSKFVLASDSSHGPFPSFFPE
jgi:hypothetical protein